MTLRSTSQPASSPRVDDDVFPKRIRALPQFEAIRAMHRLAGK